MSARPGESGPSSGLVPDESDTSASLIPVPCGSCSFHSVSTPAANGDHQPEVNSNSDRGTPSSPDRTQPGHVQEGKALSGSRVVDPASRRVPTLAARTYQPSFACISSGQVAAVLPWGVSPHERRSTPAPVTRVNCSTSSTSAPATRRPCGMRSRRRTSPDGWRAELGLDEKLARRDDADARHRKGADQRSRSARVIGADIARRLGESELAPTHRARTHQTSPCNSVYAAPGPVVRREAARARGPAENSRGLHRKIERSREHGDCRGAAWRFEHRSTAVASSGSTSASARSMTSR